MNKSIIIFLISLVTCSQSFGQNEFNLGSSNGSRFSVTDKVWPANIGDGDVCMWNDDKLAAYTITIDDNIESEVPFWKTMITKYGFNFTWFVITEAAPQHNVQDWNLYRDLANLGSEVQGHDDRNWYESPSEGETNPTDEEYLARLEATKTKIDTEVTTGNTTCLTYAYPYGEGNQTEAAKAYISMRGTLGLLNQANTVNYNDINSVSSHYVYPDDTKRDTYILPLLNTSSNLFGTNYYRGWGSTHFHSIGGEANENLVDEFLQYLTEKPDLWVAGFTEVSQYSQSFATHNLTVDNVTDLEIKFTLTDDMLNSAFYSPLTVKFRIDNSWTSISATQNGTPIDTEIKTNSGKKYALVKAVPDAGQVTLTGVADADPAVISTVNDQSMIEGESLQIDFSASTIGGDAISFSAENLPSFAVLTDNGNNTGKIIFNPEISDAGNYLNITILANNGRSSTAEIFQLSVSPDSNGAPTTLYEINPNGDGIISDVSNLPEGGTNPWLNGNSIDGTSVLKLGQSASTGDPYTTNAIIPFQLPVRPIGKNVVAAQLKINIAYIRHWIGSSIDLYGLPYKSNNTISPSDFYDQTFPDAAFTATGIQDSYVVRDTEGSEPLGTEILTDREVTTNSSGDLALTNYLNAQYDAGAIAGDYVFLRLSVDATQGSVGAHYYGISDESTNEAPLLTIEMENTLSIQENTLSSIQFFPNPLSNGELKINSKGIDINNCVLKIYSTAGNLVFQETLKQTSNDFHRVQLNLKPGLYIINLHSNSSLKTHKLLIQ